MMANELSLKKNPNQHNNTFLYMIKYLILIITAFGFFSCGSLKYETPETAESAEVRRKNAIQNYIRKEYTDSAVTYNSLLFGQATVIKPTNFILLDSLFKIKYNNEMRGTFDSDLEEKIGNQQQVIQQDTAKVKYLEHHVYSITNNGVSEISFADVTVDSKANVLTFKITEQVSLEKKYKNLFSAYLTEESILQPPYNATVEESNFYLFYKQRKDELPTADKPQFLNHTLHLMETARTIRSIDTKKLLQELTIQSIYNRNYDSTQDLFQSIDGEFLNDKLIGYAVVILVNNSPVTVRFTPYLEKIG